MLKVDTYTIVNCGYLYPMHFACYSVNKVYFLIVGAFPAAFLFIFMISIHFFNPIGSELNLPMNGFEPRISVVGCAYTTNSATTTAPSK